MSKCILHRHPQDIPPPPTPHPPLVYTYLVSFPQTLTAAGAEVWVGAHYLFMEPSQKEGRVFFFFWKGVKWGFLFWVTLFCMGKSDHGVICSMCRVCATSSILCTPHPGNNFRSPSFNGLSSWMCLFHWSKRNCTLYLSFWDLLLNLDLENNIDFHVNVWNPLDIYTIVWWCQVTVLYEHLEITLILTQSLIKQSIFT